MRKYSYSQVSCFENCPYQWKLRYQDKLKVIDSQEPDNALYVGSALHKGIETNVAAAIYEYLGHYYLINDLHINEILKLETLIPKAKELIPQGDYEVKIEDDNFVGYIDLLVKVGDNEYDIWDFKYSNNVDRYMKSAQLHVYKDKFEKITGGKVRNLYFLFIPKTAIRQKKTEDLYAFRERLKATLDELTPQLVKVEYDEKKVKEFYKTIEKIETFKDYPKNESALCRFCDYEKYCKNNETWMFTNDIKEV